MSPSACARCGCPAPRLSLDWKGRGPCCAPSALCPLCHEAYQPCDGPCPCRDGEGLSPEDELLSDDEDFAALLDARDLVELVDDEAFARLAPASEADLYALGAAWAAA